MENYEIHVDTYPSKGRYIDPKKPYYWKVTHYNHEGSLNDNSIADISGFAKSPRDGFNAALKYIERKNKSEQKS